MKQFKKIFALVLALMLVLSLCACGKSGDKDSGNTEATANSEPTTNATEKDPTQETTEPEIPDGKVQYKVKVVDEEGNPIVGAMMQACTDETCLIPAKTDDAGVATFAPADEDKYHVNFLTGIPAGYEADAEVFYFAEGETELTIVLKAISG